MRGINPSVAVRSVLTVPTEMRVGAIGDDELPRVNGEEGVESATGRSRVDEEKKSVSANSDGDRAHDGSAVVHRELGRRR